MTCSVGCPPPERCQHALSESFTYDALSRLAAAQIGVDIAKSFAYDANGNQTGGNGLTLTMPRLRYTSRNA